MRSKSVVDRQKVAQALIAAARTHAQSVGDRLLPQLATVIPEGETLPDLVQLQELFVRLLEARLKALVEAEEAHRAELDGTPRLRMRRDEASSVVQQQILALREAVSAVYGSEQMPHVLGFDGPTAQTPLDLQRQAQRIVSRLQEPVTVEPVSEVLSAEQLDLTGAAERLRETAQVLDEAIQEVLRKTRQAETTLGRRDEALEAFDVTVRCVGLTLRSFLSLAGFSELADRLRLTLPGSRSKSGRRTRKRSRRSRDSRRRSTPSSDPSAAAGRREEG